jgi:hypothetical protein
MQRQEAPLADNVAAEIDIDIRLLAEVLGDPRLPVARVDKIDNAEEILLICSWSFSPNSPQRLGMPRRQ